MSRLGVSLAIVSWFVIGFARADTPKTPPQSKADELFDEGRKLLNEGQAAAACEKFGQAIQLDSGAAGTMLNLGLCNEKLEKFKTALYWFRKAQFRATETHLLDHEKAAREHTTDLATKVATIKIAFSDAPPAGAKVKIDGEDVKPDDYAHVEVDPGHHALDAGAPGKKIVHQEFDVEGKGGQTLTLQFVTGENSVVVDRGAGRRKAALYTAIGGGVFWLAAGGLSYWASDQYTPYKMRYDAHTATPSDIEQGNHYKNIARYGGTTLFGIGTVAVGVAAVLYFTAPDKERIDQTVWVPTVGPDQVGVAASGSF
jgi:hypothetical protein